jgi:flagellar basal-body rod protein FlgG
MNASYINAAVSMHALQQKLDLIANNVANIDTTGFKKKDATFEDILTNIKDQPRGFQQQGRLSPLGFNQGWGAKLTMAQLNLSQGALMSTGTETDVALEGGALFEISVRHLDENGQPVLETGYTRDGSFQLAVQPQDPDFRYLTTKDGHMVMGTDDQPIRIPKEMKMVIDELGNVRAYPAGQSAGTSVPIGTLKLNRVIRPQYLEQIGENVYRLLPGVNNANGEVLQLLNQGSALEEKVAVRQGFLEKSNVNMGDEMTDLMTTQRAFQLSSRALQSAEQMMGMANNLRV